MPRPPKKRPFSSKGRPPAPVGTRRVLRKRTAPARLKSPVEGEDDRGERLQKVLAAAGVASRRECEALILEGRVQVDGQIVSELGARVDRQRQEIKLDGEPLARPKLQYFAVNKPAGVVCTARDPSGRTRVIDLLPPGVGRMFNVGRLDMESEGLILVTNDGELANQLTHPRHGVEKVYHVQVAGSPEPDVLAQIQRGVHLAEGFVRIQNVRVKSRKKNSSLLEMVLDEGRNREIRRLLAKVGHKVQRLTRIAVGPVRLGEMPRGSVRLLTREEIQKLRAAIARGPQPAHDGGIANPSTGAPIRPASQADRERKRKALAAKAGVPERKSPRKPRKPTMEQEAPERRIIGEALPAAQRPPKIKPRPRQGAAGARSKGTGAKGSRPQRPGRPNKRSGSR